MKKLTSIFAVLFLMTLSVNVFAQNVGNTASTTSSASARIISPISILKVRDLNFGNIASTTEGGYVTLVVANDGAVTRSFENTEAEVTTLLSTPTSSEFHVSGEGDAHYSVTLPGDNEVTLAGPSSSDGMDLVTFTKTSAGVLNASGTETFYVGATLLVNPLQMAGVYSATYSVTVEYE